MATDTTVSQTETQRADSETDEQQDSEQQPLLAAESAKQKQREQVQPVSIPDSPQQQAAAKVHSRSNSLDKKNVGQCR